MIISLKKEFARIAKNPSEASKPKDGACEAVSYCESSVSNSMLDSLGILRFHAL